MNVIFLVICTLSILFFVVFLVECSRPLRRLKKAPVVRKSTEASVIDSATGRRSLAHLEQQMAEFLSHHGRTTAGLLIALALMPVMLRAKNGQSAGQGQMACGKLSTSVIDCSLHARLDNISPST
jgi:hypothetical protein